MLKNNYLYYLTPLFLLLFTGNMLLHAGKQEVSAIEAMQLFDAGEYEAAEKAFRQLLRADPGNTMLNYYYGASRTETGHFSDDDMNFLLNAGKEVTPVRINYYLGVQHHARNNFDQALKYYNAYRVSVPEGEQEKSELALKIQMCFDRINPYEKEITAASTSETQPETIQPEAAKTDEKQDFTGDTETGSPDKPRQEPPITPKGSPENREKVQTVILAGSDSLIISSEVPQKLKPVLIDAPRRNLPDLPGVKPTITLPDGDPIDFYINNNITYLNTAHFKTEQGKTLFTQGNALREKMEQTRKETTELREKYRMTQDQEEKAALSEKILNYETEAYQLREAYTQMLSESRRIENQYWQNANKTARENFITEMGKIKALQEYERARLQQVEESTEDAPEIPSSDLLNILDLSLEPPDETTDQRLTYKIQIGAFSRGVPAYMERLYNKLEHIRKIENYTDENGVVVYTTGNLTNMEDAMRMQNQVRQEGIKDAFVVPYFNGKRITLEQAKKLEASHATERD